MTTCRKIRHATKRDAVAHLYHLWQKYRYIGHCYRCPECRAWHVGRRRRKPKYLRR